MSVVKGYNIVNLDNVPQPEVSTANDFILAESISNNAHKVAIHNLVDSLIANNLWSYFTALYLGVGNLKTTNLKAPGTFDLTFPGSRADNITSVRLSNGQYANTNIPYGNLNPDSIMMLVWNKDENANGALMGIQDTQGNKIGLEFSVSNVRYGNRYSVPDSVNFSQLAETTAALKRGIILGNTLNGTDEMCVSGARKSLPSKVHTLDNIFVPITINGLNSPNGIIGGDVVEYHIVGIGNGIPEFRINTLIGIISDFCNALNPTKDKRIMFLGDSITAGAGASDYNNAYYNVAANAKGLSALPFGSYGRTVQRLDTNYPLENSAEYLLSNVPYGSITWANTGLYIYNEEFKYLVVRLGVNDVLQKSLAQNPVDDFKAKYRMLLERIIKAGWPQSKIKLVNIGLISYATYPDKEERLLSFNTAISELASEYNVQLIDLYSFHLSLGSAYVLPDGLHPNDDSHILDGNYIATVI